MTVIMATHDVDLVRRYADRVLRLEAGHVVDFDRPERVIPAARIFRGFSRPQTVPAQRSEPVLVFEKLHHVYPGAIVALRGVDLRFGAGEFVGVVGRNGSGKTTLLKCAVSLLAPSAGRVVLNGKDLKNMKVFELAQSVGYVQQNPDLQLFAETVRKEVSFGPENLRYSAAEIERKTAAALLTAGLEGFADEHPLGLGRGERGLTVLASVLAMEPAVLLLDEPTRGQDAAGCSRIMEIALKARNAGCAVIAVGHDLGLLAEYVDRLVVMDGGMVVADGPPRTILENVGLLRSAGLRPPEKSGNLVVPERNREGVYGDEACEDIQETVCIQ
jgi:energy-coupling factor transport system ATP-binding protein